MGEVEEDKQRSRNMHLLPKSHLNNDGKVQREREIEGEVAMHLPCATAYPIQSKGQATQEDVHIAGTDHCDP